MSALDDILAKLGALPPEEFEKVAAQAQVARKELGFERWLPTVGPQLDAYNSEADVLLYGGEPGGGKSQLICGLAYNAHERSLIMRRQYGDLDRLVEDVLKIHGSREGFNGSPPPKLKIDDRRIVDFSAAHRVGDEQNQMGKGHDFLGIDEATHFIGQQIRFLMGWVRTENRTQRTRTVLATNPPLTAEGLWVTQMFAPWLDDRFPYPAKFGELRWAVSDDDGNMKWVDGPSPIQFASKLRYPKSYTYIHASVRDNPYYAGTNYERELDNMGEPHRSILLGGFKTSFKDQQNQIIPTAWIKAAQERWTPKPPDDVPMCTLAVDCSGGGNDPMVVARRHDGWYAPFVEVPGNTIPMDRSGAFCGGVVVSHRRDDALVVVDLGGGYGGPTYEHLKANSIETKGFRGAEATRRRSVDGKLHFTNKRTAALWLFREALDPGQPGGSPIALPDDPVLVADLTAPTFEPTPNGIRAESKEHVCERLGRSTDRGDACVMAWFEGPSHATAAMEWMDRAEHRQGKGFKPRVIRGGRTPLTARQLH